MQGALSGLLALAFLYLAVADGGGPQVLPLGKIAGRVKLAERGERLPDSVSVTTLAVPKYLHRPEAPKGLLDCPFDKKGTWSCSLPALQDSYRMAGPCA